MVNTILWIGRYVFATIKSLVQGRTSHHEKFARKDCPKGCSPQSWQAKVVGIHDSKSIPSWNVLWCAHGSGESSWGVGFSLPFCGGVCLASQTFVTRIFARCFLVIFAFCAHLPTGPPTVYSTRAITRSSVWHLCQSDPESKLCAFNQCARCELFARSLSVLVFQQSIPAKSQRAVFLLMLRDNIESPVASSYS